MNKSICLFVFLSGCVPSPYLVVGNTCVDESTYDVVYTSITGIADCGELPSDTLSFDSNGDFVDYKCGSYEQLQCTTKDYTCTRPNDRCSTDFDISFDQPNTATGTETISCDDVCVSVYQVNLIKR